MSAPQHVAGVAVFDFDHTLCRFDSSAHFFYWLIRQQFWRLLLCSVLAPLVLPLFCFRRTQKLPVRIAVRLASVGRPLTDLPELIQDYLRQAQQNWAYDEGLARLRWHQENGEQIVIATGSLQLLVTQMLSQAGLKNIRIIGSILVQSRFGWVSAQHCIGKKKIPLLQAEGINPPWQYAYSDHFADLPLLKNAETAFLVNPRAKSLRIVRAKSLPALQILRWH